MKHHTLLLLSASLVSTLALSQGVHRCNVNGEVIFQQMPCPGSGATVQQDVKQKEQARLELEAKKEKSRLEMEAKKAEAVERERQRIQRLDSLPDSSLSYLERLQRDLRKSDRDIADMKRRDADGTSEREFQAKLDKHCGGRAIEKLRIGLTEAQVLNCTLYQRPETVNVTTSATGTRKQYVFRLFGEGSKPEYLYFRDGLLSAFQQ